MNKRFKLCFTIILLATSLILSPRNPASAATVTIDAGSGYATSVIGLILETTIYDVSFDSRSNSEWLSDLDFTSLFDATTAADALNLVLDSAGVARVQTATGSSTNDFSIPYGTDGSGALIGLHLRNPGSGPWVIASETGLLPIRSDWTITGSVSAVPLPAAFPLFAGGLGLLGLLGWRRKRMAAA